MGIFIKNRILVLAITICITFFFYRIVDFSVSNDLVFHHYQGLQHNQMIANSLGTNSSLLSNHTIVSETHPNISIDVGFIFDGFYGEDKGSLLFYIILLASFLMLHIITIQLFFLLVRRWLIKTNIIQERHKCFILKYVHRKDGKKKYYPSYVIC